MFRRGAVYRRLFPEGEGMDGVSCVEGLKRHLWWDDVIKQSLIIDTSMFRRLHKEHTRSNIKLAIDAITNPTGEYPWYNEGIFRSQQEHI